MKKNSSSGVLEEIPKEIGLVVIVIPIMVAGVYVTALRGNITPPENLWKNFGTVVENGRTHWKEAENLLKENYYQRAKKEYQKASLKFENIAERALKNYKFLHDHALLKNQTQIKNLEDYMYGSENAYRAAEVMVRSCIAFKEKKPTRAENLREEALKNYKRADNHFDNIKYLALIENRLRHSL